ncbi:survival protein SurA precursor [Bacteroides pyogenes JCM 10003]|nr:survival protein SurA precursor [Bacteroides pyogenes JCM 10003]
MKKFLNFRFVVAFVFASVAGSTAYAQDNVIDEVVWVVGDEAILKSDVEEVRLDALYKGRRFNGDPYCIILRRLPCRSCFCIRRSWTVSKFLKEMLSVR